MVGPKKQAFCPRINILKGNFDTNYFEPLRLEKLLHTSDLFLFFLSCQTFIIEWWRKRLKKKDNIEHFLECHVRWFIPFFSLDSERYLIKYWQFRKTRLSLCKKYFLELTLKTRVGGINPSVKKSFLSFLFKPSFRWYQHLFANLGLTANGLNVIMLQLSWDTGW